MNTYIVKSVAACVIFSCMMMAVQAQDKGTIAPDQIPGAVVYIPYPVTISPDGKTGDWKGVPASRFTQGYPASPDKAQNQYVDFWLAADADNIYIRAESADGNIVSGKHGANYWNEDSIDFYFNFTKKLMAQSYTSGIFQVNVSPQYIGKKITAADVTGVSSSSSKVTGFVYKTAAGWGFEAAVPYSPYFKAEHGTTIGFQIQANGATALDRDSKLIWGNSDTSDASYRDPSLFGRAVFFKTGSTDVPVPAEVSGGIDDVFKKNGAVGKAGKKQVWTDEFDSDGAPSESKWDYDDPITGTYNNELQTYTNKTANAYVKGGMLHIDAKKDAAGKWTSSRMVTRGKASWTYGYFEIKAKLPAGKGVWPALWMMPVYDTYGGWPNSGEIDIMEFVGFLPDTIHTTAHTGDYNHTKNTQKTRAGSVHGVTDGFHTYAAEWNTKGIFWYVDDKPFYYFLNDGTNSSKTWPFNKPFYLIMNVAVGGSWGGMQGVDKNMTEADMVVDYVRVYQ